MLFSLKNFITNMLRRSPYPSIRGTTCPKHEPSVQLTCRLIQLQYSISLRSVEFTLPNIAINFALADSIFRHGRVSGAHAEVGDDQTSGSPCRVNIGSIYLVAKYITCIGLTVLQASVQIVLQIEPFEDRSSEPRGSTCTTRRETGTWIASTTLPMV